MHSLRPILAGFVVLVAAAIGLLGLLGRDAAVSASPSPSVAVGVTSVPSPTGRSPTVPSPPVPSPTAASARPVASPRRLTADEQQFADAYLELAETYDGQATELLIANPLAEFDLVGTQMADLVDRTRERLASLPPLAPTTGQVRDVEREMAATVALLRAIDPHGPRSDRATQYQRALDYWIERVQPVSDEIRAALGRPPSATGDLRL